MGSTLGALKLQVAVGGMEEGLSCEPEWGSSGAYWRAHEADTGLCFRPCCIEGTPHHKPTLSP